MSASEAINPCIGKDTVELINVIGTTECEASIISAKLDADFEKKFKEDLEDKLASKLAIQVKQIMQKFGKTINLYDKSNNKEILKNTININCNFQDLSALDKNGCGFGSLNSKDIKSRLDKINKELQIDESNSLFESMISIYGESKNGKFDSKNSSCPVQDGENLNSILTNERALNLIAEAAKGDADFWGNLSFYPQYNMLEDALKFDSKIKEKFLSYIKKFHAQSSIEAKDYINQFFQSGENDSIAKGVADQCLLLKSSILKFSCNELDKLTTDNVDVSVGLFNSLVPNKNFSQQAKRTRNDKFAQKAFAMSCIEAKKENRQKVNNKKDNSCQNVTESSDLNEWFNCFSIGILNKGQTDDQYRKNFCNLFQCKVQKIANTNSCLKNNKLSYEDFKNIDKDLLANGEFKIFDEYYKSLEAYEKFKDDFSKMANNKSDSKNEARLSDFDLNAFGAKGAASIAGVSSSKINLDLATNQYSSMKEYSSIQSSNTSSSSDNNSISISKNIAPKVSNAITEPIATSGAGQAIANNSANQIAPNYNYIPQVQAEDKKDLPVPAGAKNKTANSLSDSEKTINDLAEQIKNLERKNSSEIDAIKKDSMESEIARLKEQLESQKAASIAAPKNFKQSDSSTAFVGDRKVTSDSGPSEVGSNTSQVHNNEINPFAEIAKAPVSASTQNGSSNSVGSTNSKASNGGSGGASDRSGSSAIALTQNGETTNDLNKIAENPTDSDLLKWAEKTDWKPIIIKENGKLVQVKIELDDKGKPIFENGKLKLKRKELTKDDLKNVVLNPMRAVKTSNNEDVVRMYQLNRAINN